MDARASSWTHPIEINSSPIGARDGAGRGVGGGGVDNDVRSTHNTGGGEGGCESGARASQTGVGTSAPSCMHGTDPTHAHTGLTRDGPSRDLEQVLEKEWVGEERHTGWVGRSRTSPQHTVGLQRALLGGWGENPSANGAKQTQALDGPPNSHSARGPQWGPTDALRYMATPAHATTAASAWDAALAWMEWVWCLSTHVCSLLYFGACLKVECPRRSSTYTEG